MENINESHFQEKLDEISHILSPEKFLQKHFGNEDPSEIIFNKVISDENLKTKIESSLRKSFQK